MSKQNLKNYFSKDLHWGWKNEYQAQVVFGFLQNAAAFSKKRVILDAGAGQQRYKPFFKKSLYITQEHQAGIELKKLKKKYYDLISPIDKKIPLKNNCLDAILSTVVIEHLRYPEKFLREAYRVIKPGGKIFINAPFCVGEHEIPYDYVRPTRYALKSWLEDAGFKKNDITPSSSNTESASSMLISAVLNDTFKNQGRSIFTGIAVFATKIFCKVIKMIFDKGPHEGTNLPAGWLAIGTKPGILKPASVSNKKQFLKESKL